MNEIFRSTSDIHQAIVDRAERGERFAVAVVLKAEGSTPVKAGAKAIIDPHGAIQGTVGGGAVEAETQRRAVEAIAAGQPIVFDFDLEGHAPAEATPVCGGRMRLLVDPMTAEHMTAYVAAAAARQRRERGILLTTVQSGEPYRVAVSFVPVAEIDRQASFPETDALRRVVEREQAEVFISEAPGSQPSSEILAEPLVPPPVLVIIGGGHVGQALARQAAVVGFEIVVLDDRPEFTLLELFPPGTATRCGPLDQELGRIPFGGDTYVVIVTRGHQHDAAALALCLKQPAAYVGMIGSRRKVTMMQKDFLESGRATAGEWDRLHAPIGLDIGAVTVPEIAASIVAQLIQVRRKGRQSRNSSSNDHDR